MIPKDVGRRTVQLLGSIIHSNAEGETVDALVATLFSPIVPQVLGGVEPDATQYNDVSGFLDYDFSVPYAGYVLEVRASGIVGEVYYELMDVTVPEGT